MFKRTLSYLQQLRELVCGKRRIRRVFGKSRKNVEAVAWLHVAFKQDRIQASSGAQCIDDGEIRLHIQVGGYIPKRPVEVDQSSGIFRPSGDNAREVDRNRRGTGTM